MKRQRRTHSCSVVSALALWDASTWTVLSLGLKSSASQRSQQTSAHSSGKLLSVKFVKLPTLSWLRTSNTSTNLLSTNSNKETIWYSNRLTKKRTRQELSILLDQLLRRKFSNLVVVMNPTWESTISQCQGATRKSSSKTVNSCLKTTRASSVLLCLWSKGLLWFQATTKQCKLAELL